MLLITLMLIFMAVEVPRIAQQIKRAREEELVNRGMEYAKAVKKYRRKMGALPNSVDQLMDTNHIRFLRKRYKDPMTGEDDWKLIHVGEAEIPMPQGANPGLQGSGTPGLQGGTFTNTPGAKPSPTPSGQTSLLNSPPGGGPTIGGGGIIGVASTSKNTGIKEFHDSNHYDEWLFVYDPRLEQAAGAAGGATGGGGNAGIIVAAPRAGGSGSSGGGAAGGATGGVSGGVQAPPPPGGASESPGQPQVSPTPSAGNPPPTPGATDNPPSSTGTPTPTPPNPQ
jgi:type II secretory pathway pseudopilin PulG